MNTTAKISTTASEASNLPAADPGRAPDLGPHFTSDWDAALAIYSTKRAASDAMRDAAEGVDEAVDAYCEAMDYLIEKVPAPNLQALFAKIEMAHSRSADFVSMFDDHQTGIATDHNSSSICLRPIMGVSQGARAKRSEEHPSELQSLMRLSYAVLCLK